MISLTRKIFNASTQCIIISFFVTCYTILFYKNYQNVISDKTVSLISELAAWIPMLTCIFVCIIYSFVMFSETAKKIRSKIYLSIFFQFANAVLIMLPREVTERIDSKINIVILSFLFTVCFLLHDKIRKELVKGDFSFKREFAIMDKVNDEIKKTIPYKWSNFFNRISWLLAVPFVIQPSPLIFSYMTAAIAMILICILIKYIRCYKRTPDAEVCRINFAIIILNYIMFIFLGIIFYYFFEFKLISFMTLYFALFSKFMADNKYALFIRDKLNL